MSALTTSKLFRFGLFEADLDNARLTRKGVRIRLQEQPFRILAMLLDRSGQVVTREELRQQLWPEGTYVDFDGSLNAAFKRLRSALDDDPDNPRFIETIPKRGYRFIAPVSVDEPAPVLLTPKPEPEFESSSVPSNLPSTALQKIRPWVVLAALVLSLLLAASGWRYFHRDLSVARAAPKVIGVLPFSNQGAGSDFDYLRYAIANDLVTDLTHARSVTVRPFASTSKYGTQPPDPAAAGKELNATHIVAGSFLMDKQSLRVNLELVDVAKNQVVSRDEISVPPQEVIALHDKLALCVTQWLLPATKVLNASADEIPSPKNQEAFDLFLHAVTVPLDPGPNRMAIKKLEESLSLDGSYAPAWGELGWRYYLDYRYGSGDEAQKAKCLQAFTRQSELDPNSPGWTTIRVEQGDLDGAYDEVAQVLRRRPDFSGAHFGMSYVLRYAGLLGEAGKECDTALALDPVNGYRSCATTFTLAGDYAHAQRYIDLDKTSGVAALMRMERALRMRNLPAALVEANAAAELGYQSVDAKLARVYLSHASPTELAKTVEEVEADPVSSHDPELLYHNAAVLAFCGQKDAALRQLRKAIEGNYCSYPAIDKDPLFDSIRQLPEFAELRLIAVQCQQHFVTHRKSVDAALAAAPRLGNPN